MGIIMKKTALLAGIAIAVFGLFANQTFAASGCVTAACDPAAAAAAACDPAAADPASAPAADYNSSNPSADSILPEPADPEPDAPAPADPASVDAAPVAPATGSQAACNSGALSAAPGCGSCSACGNAGCNGLCGSCAPRGCADLFFGKLKKSFCEGVCWSGYINGGYNTNFKDDVSNGYTDCWSNSTPAFNAVYVAAEKKAYTGGCGYDFGFGVDFMFGEDSRFFRSSKGFDQSWDTGRMFNPDFYEYDIPSYGFAMPQLYLETAINNWSVKLGRFNALLGYERATANSRFFYTKGLTCAATPVSQTGVLTTYNGFENLDITLGWVSGWGCAFDNCEWITNDNTDESMVTAAFTYRMNQYAYIKYAFVSGTTTMDDVVGGIMGPKAYYVANEKKGLGNVHNVILWLQLTNRLESVSTALHGDVRYGFNTDSGFYYTILGQHLYYTLNCCWKVGFRAEWEKMSVLGDDATELTSFTIGANWHPAGNQNLYVRPELRYDRVTGPFGGDMLNGRADQFTIGFDVMLTF